MRRIDSPFLPFNMSDWPRREYFLNYTTQDQNQISFTGKLDISNFKKALSDNKMRFFPSLLALISIIINRHEEFKIAYNDQNRLGIYEFINPSYTIFHVNDKTFSCIHSKFINDFDALYNNIVEDMFTYQNLRGFEPVKAPLNSFPVTSIPWYPFSSFSIIEHGVRREFFPFIIIGKYIYENGMLCLPLTFQINHAVADAYHISMFFVELQKTFNHFDQTIIKAMEDKI